MKIEPCTTTNEEFEEVELPIGTTATDLFPAVKSGEPWKKFACVACQSDRLQVARRSYTTMVRCPTCGWVETIHDG